MYIDLKNYYKSRWRKENMKNLEDVFNILGIYTEHKTYFILNFFETTMVTICEQILILYLKHCKVKLDEESLAVLQK